MSQSDILAITRNLLKAREKPREQGELVLFCFLLVEKLARDF